MSFHFFVGGWVTSLALASPQYCDWPATARSSLTTRRRLL